MIAVSSSAARTGIEEDFVQWPKLLEIGFLNPSTYVYAMLIVPSVDGVDFRAS